MYLSKAEWIKKIEFIDEMRSKFTASENEALKLPQIIVVGDQSSGKSSILQAISGIKLPRGVNTVTKCPVVMQMRKSADCRKQIKYKSEPFRDISDTDVEIIKIQQNVFNDQLTKDPITISIQSPDSLILTIIDLPGLVKADVQGQARDMVDKTHEIARDFMKQANSLIICVLPANQDICTTTTIKEAIQCNPDKSRIIGVLTKLDKLDDKEATTIPEIINNRKLPIAKGYYGLIVSDYILNIDDKDERTANEETILKNKGLWNKEDAKRFGLSNFTAALEKELVILIDKSFPMLRKNIDELLKKTYKNLESFSKYDDNEELQKKYISETIKDIKKKTKNLLVKGTHKIRDYDNIKKYLEEKNILTSIKEHETFLFMWHDVFKNLYKNFNKTFKDFFVINKAKYGNESYLEEIINKNRTENISLFISSDPFKNIVSEALTDFKSKTSECVEDCCEIITFIIQNVLTTNIEGKLFQLKNEIEAIGHRILSEQKDEIKKYLDYLFNSEKSYFSQDDIVESYDKEPTNENVESVGLPRQLSASQSQQSMLNPQQMPKANLSSIIPANMYQMNPTRNNNSSINLAGKPPENENPTNKNGKLLKEYLKKYLTNTIRKLGDVIPNFIRQSLFVDFSKFLILALETEIVYQKSPQTYFKITEHEKSEFDRLKETKRSLEEYSKRINEFNL